MNKFFETEKGKPPFAEESGLLLLHDGQAGWSARVAKGMVSEVIVE